MQDHRNDLNPLTGWKPVPDRAAVTRRPPPPPLRAALLLFLPVTLLSCAAPTTQDVTLTAARNVPESRLEEVRIAALLADPGQRREMRQSGDVGIWLDSFWRRIDPSPGTPVNEALGVYMQRSTFMQQRFPDLDPNDWPELWVVFLRLGLSDWQGPEYVTWGRTTAEGERRTLPSIAGGFELQRMLYGSPYRFRIIFEHGEIQPDPGVIIPWDPPSLDGVWEILEGEGASSMELARALTNISWYEIPGVSRRLLAIPAAKFSSVQEVYDEALYRLAIRSAYLLEIDGIRRLAALIAAGAEPARVLLRAVSGPYTAEILAQDLAALQRRQYRLARTPNRGPHPRLWRDPEGLLQELIERYPTTATLTGWDWRGDVILALGAPAFLDQRNRSAHYLWGTPELLGIGDTMMGRVDATRLNDPLQAFVEEAGETIQIRRQSAGEAATTLTGILSESASGRSGRITTAMLNHLHVLAPPAVYSVAVPREALQDPIPITTDIVAFPAAGDSVEIQATFGIPARAVDLRQEQEFMVTDLRTNFLLVDHELQARHAESRQQGYVIRTSEGVEGRFFLDTYRFFIPVGSYIAYLSAEDPLGGTSGGVLMSLDLTSFAGDQLIVSPILLASDIRPAEEDGRFVRGDELILPAPSRRFLYGQELFFHYEVSNLTRSDLGDCAYSESLFIIPNDVTEGIITVSSGQDISSLQPNISRSMNIDLSSLGRTYEGAVFLVVLVTDRESGEQAVGATWLSLRRPPEAAPPPARN